MVISTAFVMTESLNNTLVSDFNESTHHLTMIWFYRLHTKQKTE